MNHPLSDMMTSSMGKIRDMIDVNTVIGDPISAGDVTAAKSRLPVRRHTAQTDRGTTRDSPRRRQTSHLPAARPVPCPAAREAHLCRPRPPRPKRPSVFQIPSRSATRPLSCATYTEPAARRPPARSPALPLFPSTPPAKRAAELQSISAIFPFFTPRRG